MTLKEWLRQERKTYAAFGSEIDRTKLTVARFANHLRIPDRCTMGRIYQLSGGRVQPNDFYDLPEMPVACEEMAA